MFKFLMSNNINRNTNPKINDIQVLKKVICNLVKISSS